MTPAIVLAAGTSSRYRARNKLLAPLAGAPLVAQAVAGVVPAARPVIVVTGFQGARVRHSLRAALGPRATLRFVHSPDFRRGMAASLRAGLAALPVWAPCALVCLADMPGVDSALVRRLRAAWRPWLDYVRPTHRGRPGHPVLIAASLFARLGSLSGDRGARAILQTVPRERRRLVAWHVGCLEDADTPAALRAAAARTRAHRLRSLQSAAP